MSALVCVGCGRVGFDALNDGVASSRYREAVLADGPLVYWRMGHHAASDTIPDETGTTNELMLTGGFTVDAAGAIANDADGAVAFDGATAYGTASDPNPFQFVGAAPFSLELWVARTGTLSDYQHLVNVSTGQGGSRLGWFSFVTPNGNGGTALEWDPDIGGQPNCDAALTPPDSYVHVVETFDGTTGMVYVDGVAGCMKAWAGALPAQAAALIVGADHQPVRYFFHGSLDEIAIYGRALSAATIAEHSAIGHGM